uniref:Alpha N-terminal protein methyltransferase 1 n=1 Tax=Gongylonema pulchrum TaxID=637853 RepID=A0A183EQG4_9BILA
LAIYLVSLLGSAKYIGVDETRVGNKFVCGLQDFQPAADCYDLIWVQWVTGYLTDDDFCKFLRRCKEGLREGGCIVLKDNVASSEDVYDFDEQDNSWTRPRSALLRLFNKAGLSVVAERKQTHFPKGMLRVYMFALK